MGFHNFYSITKTKIKTLPEAVLPDEGHGTKVAGLLKVDLRRSLPRLAEILKLKTFFFELTLKLSESRPNRPSPQLAEILKLKTFLS